MGVYEGGAVKAKEPPGADVKSFVRQAATLSDIEKAADKLKDAREEAFRDIVRKLYGYEAINFIGRLSQNLAYHINKHIIAEKMFVRYWSFFRLDFSVVPCEQPPFWRINACEVVDEAALAEFEKVAYKEVIQETQALTVSINGEGRREGLSVLNDARRELEVQELRQKQSLWGRMTGGGGR